MLLGKRDENFGERRKKDGKYKYFEPGVSGLKNVFSKAINRALKPRYIKRLS